MTRTLSLNRLGLPSELARVTAVVVPPGIVDPAASTVEASAATTPAGTAVTITVTVVDTASGAPVVGATVVLSASGTGNTLTQPGAVTDANGVATGTFASSVAEAKVISATAAGVAITDTAAVTVEAASGVVEPFFEDDFAGPGFNNANGFTWGGLNGTAVVTFDGAGAIRFRYGPDAPGEDSTAEQRFTLGRDCTDVWIEYDLHVPANFAHRDEAPDNNKFLQIWRDTYGSGSGTWQAGYEFTTDATSTPNSLLRPMSSQEDESFVTSGGLDHTGAWQPFIGGAGPVAIDAWSQIRMQFSAASAGGVADGIMRIWVNGVLFGEVTNAALRNFGDSPTDVVLRQGYFMGWANSGFLEQTDFHIRAVKFYNTNPGWA